MDSILNNDVKEDGDVTGRALTVRAVADDAAPPARLARQMPRLLGSVAADDEAIGAGLT